MRYTIGKVLRKFFIFFQKLFYHFIHDVSIRKKLASTSIIVTLVPVLILGAILFKISRSNLIAVENSLLIQTTKQLVNVIDFYMEGIVNKSDIIFRNTNIQDMLAKKYDNDVDRIDMQIEIRNMLLPLILKIKYPNMRYSTFSSMYDRGISIIIYSNNDTIIPAGIIKEYILIKEFKEIENDDWYKEMMEQKSTFFWRPTYEKFKENKINNYFSLNWIFFNFKTMEMIGILSIEISEESIRNILRKKEHGDDWSIYLLTKEGRIVSKISKTIVYENIASIAGEKDFLTEEEGFSNIKIGSDEYRTYFATSDLTGWRLLVVASNHSIRKGISQIVITTVSVCIVSFLGTLMIIMLLSRTITRRLQRLTTKAQSVQDDTSIALEVMQGKDEIAELDRQFNKMIYRINNLIETEYKIRLDVKLLEVEFLQEQLNPHLLYNSLTAIRWTAKKHNMKDIYGITEDLIAFYKASLSKGNVFILISDEINIVDKYISLNRSVYNLDLDYELDIDKKINSFYCIKLLLQPVIENALIHGLRNSSKKGLIKINGRIMGNTINFEIFDNGEGMADDSITEKKGFGLSNARKRIKLFFGEEYDLTINSTKGIGTVVRILIPCCDKETIEKLYGEKWLSN